MSKDQLNFNNYMHLDERVNREELPAKKSKDQSNRNNYIYIHKRIVK